jgi:hypothetical protein
MDAVLKTTGGDLIAQGFGFMLSQPAAFMRGSQTIVEEDSFWLRGHDGAHFVAVAVGRDWVSRQRASQ